MKGDPNVNDPNVNPEAQGTAWQGVRAGGSVGKDRDIRRVTCCVAGCGPAGAMLGLLLARKGIDVLVLEKHGDFLRDFRGDTIHPSTMEIMDELGLADRLLRLPHTKAPELRFRTPQGSGHTRRLSAPQDALPLHHLHAPVGLPRLRHEGGRALPELPPGDERRGKGAL